MSQERRAHARVRRELHCGTCGRAEHVSTGALLRFTKEGWPKCCGETMALRDSEEPGAPNTDFSMELLRDQDE
jgi:hypothetical protein